jgi:Ca2+-binding RTX toxin-like protein
MISAGDGDNVINSGIDNDNITTGSGHDTITAEDGNDIIVAGAGRELIDAGAGNDLITVGALRGPVQDPERLDRIDGGAGFDIVTADYSNQTLPISVIAGQTQSYDFADGAYVRNFENVHDFFTGSGNDSLRLDGAADDAFANLLKTGMGSDIIYSGGGSDDVDAGDGDDFVNGGNNSTVLILGPTFGQVLGFTGPAEILAGGAGIDTISFVDAFKPRALFRGAILPRTLACS